MVKEDLWKKYKKTKENIYKQELIKEYINLVKIVAGRLYNFYGGKIEFDDLLGYGVFGLIDAIEKYDLERDLKFETYAQIRIRGSIIDQLRKLDWVPRSLRKKAREYENVINKLENKLGRNVNTEDIARELNVDKEEVNNTLSQLAVFNTVSFEELLLSKGEPRLNNTYDTPEDIYEQKEINEILIHTIDNLGEKERLVISLYYYNELTYKEIGEILNLSESRISQIHSKAIMTIKNKLRKKGIMSYK